MIYIIRIHDRIEELRLGDLFEVRLHLKIIILSLGTTRCIIGYVIIKKETYQSPRNYYSQRSHRLYSQTPTKTNNSATKTINSSYIPSIKKPQVDVHDFQRLFRFNCVECSHILIKNC